MPRWFLLFVGSCLILVLFAIRPHSAFAESSQSTNFRFDESTVGAGGLIQSSSNSFLADSVLGDLGIGNSASSGYQLNAGSKTTADPTLSFAINQNTASFGSFSPSGPTTAVSTFSVLNYTSYGYIVQISGTPPTYGSHTINAMTSTGASQFGIEQFGINLVANTSPLSFGANPDHGQFGNGSATANYGTANQFRYISGETIASASASSGLTTYTISYLVNVSSLTPGGQYTSNQTLIVTGTY